jgi:hypothetical protein
MTTQLINLNSPEFLANPYPFYKHLRDTTPRLLVSAWGPTSSMWLVTDAPDCGVNTFMRGLNSLLVQW